MTASCGLSGDFMYRTAKDILEVGDVADAPFVDGKSISDRDLRRARWIDEELGHGIEEFPVILEAILAADGH